MSEGKALLACPFCGIEAELITAPIGNGIGHYVRCLGPGCTMEGGGSVFWHPDSARAAWNCRAPVAPRPAMR